MRPETHSRVPVHRAHALLQLHARHTPRAKASRRGSTARARAARGSPRRRRVPRVAENEGAGAATEDRQQCPVMQVKERETPSSPTMGADATFLGFQMEGKEKEAHDYFVAFVNNIHREKASKVRFLESICTLCRAWLQSRYQPSSSSAHSLVEKMEAIQQKELLHSMDPTMWQQAILAINAMSKEREGLLDRHLSSSTSSIFHVAPAQEMESQCVSLDAQILKTLDSVLEVVMHGGLQGSSLTTVEKSLEVLVPFTASQDVATRRRSVGTIVSLSQYMMPSLMLEALPFRAGGRFLFQTEPLDVLGPLMGHLTLACAEQDQIISDRAAEALRAFHKFILLQRGSPEALQDPELWVVYGSVSTSWPKEPTDAGTVFGRFLLPPERTDFVLVVLKGMVHPRVSDIRPVGNMLEMVLGDSWSDLNKVDEIIKTIHTQLACVSQEPLRDILKRTLLQVARLHTWEATTSLLVTSLDCDSTARAMWSTLASDQCLVDSVLKVLLMAQQKGPKSYSLNKPCCWCCRFTAVTAAMHQIFLGPWSEWHVQLLLEELFMALVSQVFFSLQGSQQCCCVPGQCYRGAKHLPDRAHRSAMSAMQALFHCLGGSSLVEDIRKQGAWDMLGSVETYHTGITVLTKVLQREIPDCGFAVAEQAVVSLLQKRAYQDIGAMAVFVQLLDCIKSEDVTGRVLYVLQCHLQSKTLVLRKMAVASLVTLSGRRGKAATLQGLLPDVIQRLQDDDHDIRMEALKVLGNMLRLVDRQTAVPVALQLVEPLLPLFENESSCVRELSILLCRDAMEVAVSTHAKQMRKDVQKSLMPLFFHLHDKDHNVAQASRSALHEGAKLLKHKKLQKLLKTEQTWRVGKCLLMGDRTRLEEHLHQSLLYLRSPEQPLREVAIRLIGLTGLQLRDELQEEFQVIYEALQDTKNDSSPSISTLATETLLMLDSAVEEPPSGLCLHALYYRLRRAWRRRRTSAL